MRKRWWFFIHYRCPVCGKEIITKELRADRKPLTWEERHEFVEMYDYCNEGHF